MIFNFFRGITMNTFLYVVNVKSPDGTKENLVPLATVIAKDGAEVHNIGVAAAITADAEVDVRALEVLVCNPFRS